MTRTEHLLTILMEECAEVAQRCSKALRFTLEEVQPGQTLTNAERITVELADFLGAWQMLGGGYDGERRELFMPWPIAVWYDMIDQKKQKIEKFLTYSQEQGTLQEESVCGVPVADLLSIANQHRDALQQKCNDLQGEVTDLKAELDPAICRLQFPDGTVPANLKEAAEGWKKWYYDGLRTKPVTVIHNGDLVRHKAGGQVMVAIPYLRNQSLIVTDSELIACEWVNEHGRHEATFRPSDLEATKGDGYHRGAVLVPPHGHSELAHDLKTRQDKL